MAREFAKQLYKSKEWQAVRDYVLRRDNFLCQLCGAPAEEVHHKIHLNPSNVYDPKVNLNPDNLISLCRTCHIAQHRQERSEGQQNRAQIPYEYEFDSNGMLIRKEYTAPVSPQK